MLKSILLFSQLAWAAALSPGDCAFVGIYGDQDDFALVMMEDVDGEDLSLTEEYPSNSHFEVKNFVVAKKHVSKAKRGTVLKKEDFETDASTFVAPMSLTVFSGNAKFPTALCSINMEATKGSIARKLDDQVSVVMLGLTETAQYAGSFSGNKDELLEEISNSENWQRSAPRKLDAFSIAMKNQTNTSMTTTTTTEEGPPPSRTVVSACTELGGDLDQLEGSKDAEAAIAEAVSGLLELPLEYVQNVVFTPGSSCGGRRLNDRRRLQTGGTVTYDLVFPASLGTEAAEAAAQQAMTTLSSATIEEVQTLVTQAIATYPSLSGVTVTVTSVTTSVTTETGGTTSTTTTTTTTTTAAGDTSTTRTPWGGTDEPDEGDGDAAICHGPLGALALSLLMAIA